MRQINLITWTARVDEPEIQALLTEDMGNPNPERPAQVCARYREAGWRFRCTLQL